MIDELSYSKKNLLIFSIFFYTDRLSARCSAGEGRNSNGGGSTSTSEAKRLHGLGYTYNFPLESPIWRCCLDTQLLLYKCL